MKVKMFDLRVVDKSLKKDLNTIFNTVLLHGRLSHNSPELKKFEKSIANFVGTKYAIGVASGSSALYLSLKASGIGSGDEVITTPHSWIITANAIVATGATPVFVDIGDDLNINPKLIEKKITKKNKAIVQVHWGGKKCKMNEICKIAKKNNILIIEDAAQAFGAQINGKKSGSFSIAGAFSMNTMKTLNGYGEGGIVVTDNLNICKRIQSLRYAGTTQKEGSYITNNCTYVSLNHKMDTINAALLIVSMKYFYKKYSIIGSIVKKYRSKLSTKIKLREVGKNENAGRYSFPILVKNREKLIKYLESKNIETKIWHLPIIPEAPAIQKYDMKDTPKAKKLMKLILCLPLHEKLTDEQVDYTIHHINSFYEN